MAETSAAPRSRRGRWALGILVALVLLGVVGFLGVGRWLAVSDPLKPARAIVVLSGGGLPYRPMEAAALYKAGWAPEVWVTRPWFPDWEAAMKEVGVEVPGEDVYSVEVLEKLGVPLTAIRVLPEGVENTVDEERATLEELRKAHANRVIIVTSKQHTRRSRLIWRTVAGGSAELIVRGASDDPFDPAHWWRTSHGIDAVSHEIMGLINFWIGSPARPEGH